MASLLSCALLLAALCWVGGATRLAATDLCDLDNGGTLSDCLDEAISQRKDKLADWIDASGMRLTGAREFEVHDISHSKSGDSGFQPPLSTIGDDPPPEFLYMTMKLMWKSTKLFMNMTQSPMNKAWEVVSNNDEQVFTGALYAQGEIT